MFKLFPAFLLMAVAAAPVWAEDAGEAMINRATCDVLRQSQVAHTPAPDVAYTPGLDVRGNRVVGADVAPSPIKAPDEIRIPITLDLEKKYGIGSKGVFGADAPIGAVTFRGGHLYWGDAPLDAEDTAAVRAACEAAQNQPKVSPEQQ